METLSLPYRLGIMTLTMSLWLVVYFFVNRLKVDHNSRLDLGTDLDRKIPFLPQFAFVYFSTFPFALLPFLILSEARQFTWMFYSFVAITVVATTIHATVPSKIERMENVKIEGMFGGLLTWFQGTCKPYGNFPSMHVGLSVPVVGASYIAFGPVGGTITLVWAVLIALSTMFTKQHYILDVLAGAAGGSIIYGLVWWLVM